MAATQSYPWFHNNRYTPQVVCEFCDAVARHQPWCITLNQNVSNAWEAVTDGNKLTLHDQLILHALGVAWKTGRKRKLQAEPPTQ